MRAEPPHHHLGCLTSARSTVRARVSDLLSDDHTPCHGPSNPRPKVPPAHRKLSVCILVASWKTELSSHPLEADAGLEDDQGHRGRGLQLVAAWHGSAGFRCAGTCDSSVICSSNRRMLRPDRLLRTTVCARRSQAGDGQIEVTKTDPGRGLGQRALAVPGRHVQNHALRRYSADAQEDAAT